MYTISKILITSLLAVILLSFSECRKFGKNCADNVYSFKSEGARAYPDNDSLNIGDTLWLEASVPTNLKDSISSAMVNYSGAENMGIAIALLSFHSGSVNDPGSSYVMDSFDFVVKTGILVTSDQFANNYEYFETNNSYNFKLGVIPKRIGIYAVSISDAINVFRKSDKCSKANFYLNFTNTDQHLYFYQNSRPGYIISNYEREHLYCFKVY